MKLVIGTRHYLGPDWFHVDIDSTPLYCDADGRNYPVDLVCDAKRIFLPDETFDHVFSSECLEHIGWKYTGMAVKEWARLLKPGGTMRIEVPDGCVAAQQLLATDTVELHLAMSQIFYAEQTTQYDVHLALITHLTLPHYFEQAGLVVEDVKRGYECGWLRVDGRKS